MRLVHKVILTIALLFIICETAAPSNTLFPSDMRLPDHPRLFFSADAENALMHKISREKLLMDTHLLIINESRQLINVELLNRNQVGRRMLHTSREALRRIIYLSYSYRMTLETAFANRAVAEMLNVASFSDWNPSHFLDVAEMTLAIAIGYDWLFDLLTVAQKKMLSEAILIKGLQPSYLPEYNNWLQKINNWNQVCNGGIAGGAVAVWHHYPETARNIIERAIKTIPLSMHEYADNGGYPEGPHYWAYGTTYNLLLLEILEQNFGTDHGLSQHAGFLNTARYMQHLEGLFHKTGNVSLPKYFNFGDNHETTAVEPAMFWFASKLNQPELLFSEVSKLKHFLRNDPQRLLQERFLPLLLIWSPKIQFSSITAPDDRIFIANGKTEVAMMRTGWEDPHGIFVGVKGGTPSASHQHMDIGSFVMEALGIRWAIDFGMQEYHSLESKGVDLWNRSQNSQRWEVFRYKNSSHNTLTFNGKRQLTDGNATIKKANNHPSEMAVSVNMNPIYRNDIQEISRTIAIVESKSVTINDHIINNSEAASLRWNMLTAAQAQIIDKNTILLTQKGQQLKILLNGGVEAAAYIESTVPPNDYDAANEGTTFVGFNIVVPANTSQQIRVQLIPISQAH